MKTYTFRKAENGEPEAVFALIQTRMRWLTSRGILHQWEPGIYDEIYPLGYYQNAQNDLYVLVDDASGEIVSAGILFETDYNWEEDGAPAFYLHNFVSKIDSHTGDIFLARAERYAKARGKRYIRLDSDADNLGISKYYEDRGYLPVGTCTDHDYKGILRQKTL